MEKEIEIENERNMGKSKGKKSLIMVKIIIIAVLALVLIIPSGFILSMINERKELGDKALKEVALKWGGQQNIGGPILYVPFVSEVKNDKMQVEKSVEYITILPTMLDVTGSIEPEIRYRGIYKFVLYSTKLKLKGNFVIPDLSDLDLANGTLKWDEAYVLFGISDTVGIRDSLKIKWNSEEKDFYSGLKSKDLFDSGVNTIVNVIPDGKNTFELDVNIRGSEEITFIPLGKETVVTLNSKWGEPSFIGGFLPDARKVSNNNFEAKWKVLDMNRNYPQKWKGFTNKEEILSSSFGIKFLVPIDEYKQTMRAVKYMLMFVGLTFIVFFFVEILNKRKIHPIQYLLVGFSLILFYLLLLAISEHTNFIFAYIISTVSVVLLIGMYSVSVLGSKKFAAYITIMLLGLYGFLYVLLLSQDFSLLLGSIGLFVVLAVVMYMSRNINWYEVDFEKEK